MKSAEAALIALESQLLLDPLHGLVDQVSAIRAAPRSLSPTGFLRGRVVVTSALFAFGTTLLAMQRDSGDRAEKRLRCRYVIEGKNERNFLGK
jgi:hypothetical protein